MSGWDYWRGTLEAASAQAQAAASQASKFAEVVTAQVSEQSKNIAAQAAQRAGDLSKAAAESAGGARAQLAGMHLPEAFANLSLPTPDAGLAPDPEELAQYAIDADFCAFVRGLTYSTFRDFPQVELDRLVAEQDAGTHPDGNGGACGGNGRGGGNDGEDSAAVPLNPWQTQHALLVCLAVKEMNELRFVLVPKRLRDEQFWAIYFALTRSRLPPEAFDLELQKQLQPQSQQPQEPKAPLFKSDMIKPAAVAADAAEAGSGGGGGEDGKGQTWLRNLVCGFDMEVPAERLQQDTVVLGALQSRFQQLQEGARGLSLPENLRISEHLKQNISANLGNVREFVGDLVPAAARGGGGSSAAEGSSDVAAAAVASGTAAAPAADAARGTAGASHAVAQQAAGSSGGDAQQQGCGVAGGEQPAVESPRGRGDGGSAAGSAELDADPDLEAYLKEMAGSDAGGGEDGEASVSNSAASLDDADFDRYLTELSQAGGGNGEGGGSDAGSDAGSGEEVELDLDEYMAAIASGGDDDDDADTEDAEAAKEDDTAAAADA